MRGQFVYIRYFAVRDEKGEYLGTLEVTQDIKHIQELIEAVHQGYHAYLIFIIQMQGAKALKPNWQTHPAFGQAMREAMSQGVQIVAYECMVTPNSLNIQHPLSIHV